MSSIGARLDRILFSRFHASSLAMGGWADGRMGGLPIARADSPCKFRDRAVVYMRKASRRIRGVLLKSGQA